jgi:hypothetical protein
MTFEMPKMPKDSKPFALGALAGALLISWMGFGEMGWKLSSSAETLAKKRAETAVTAAYAAICSAQFKSAKSLPVRIAALEKTERWSRGDTLVKDGWATMSGIAEPNRDVGQACAELLIPEKM